jgi:hypothetical protein
MGTGEQVSHWGVSQGGVDEYPESVAGVYNSRGEVGLRELLGIGKSIAGEIAGCLHGSLV